MMAYVMCCDRDMLYIICSRQGQTFVVFAAELILMGVGLGSDVRRLMPADCADPKPVLTSCRP